MLTIAFDGLDEVNAALSAYPQAIAAALAGKAEILSTALVDKIRNEKLSGDPLQSRSGALAASIAAEVAADPDQIVATIASSGVKYAAIQEYGGQTSPHEILPTKGDVLAFVVNGAQHFARRIEHPGSTIPERSYMRSSLDEMNDEIVAELSDAVTESWGTS